MKANGAVVVPLHVTVTAALFPGPMLLICSGLTSAVRDAGLDSVALTKVVSSIGLPFQLILQPAAKFVPFAFSSTAVSLIVDVGNRPVSVTAPSGGGEGSADCCAADEVGVTV
jgi:hypothetical protein